MRLLIVEDDKALAKGLKSILEHEGYIDGINNPHLDNALESTNKLGELIDKLLSLSRAEGITDTSRYSTVDLSDLTSKLAFVYESIAFEKGITLNYSIDKHITCKGDLNDLENAISIILDNAIKYTQKGGTVDILLKQQGNKKIIRVTDTGVGISPEDIPYIFDRFYVSDKSRMENSFGLGLAIAKTIINKHKGTISATSILGSGSTFEIII